MRAEISARAARSLIELVREKGQDPGPLFEAGATEERRLMDPLGWISNEEFALMADRARELTKDEDILRAAGRRIALDHNGPLSHLFRFGANIGDALAHLGRIMKFIDLNHSYQATLTGGRSARVSVSRAGDGLHTRDHCRLFMGVIQGLIEAGGAEVQDLIEISCQVPVDQAGAINGNIYRFDQDRRLLVSAAGGDERDLGPRSEEEAVKVDGSAFGSACCEYEVRWREGAFTRLPLLRRIIGLARALRKREIPEENFRLLSGLPAGPVRWESSYAMTRTKYLSYAAVILLALASLAWAAGLALAGRPVMLIAGAGYALLALAVGGSIIRSSLGHGRMFKKKAENAETMLQGSGVSVVAVSPDFTISYANQHAQGLYGQVRGRKCYEAFRWDTGPCAGCKVVEVMERNERMAMECQYIGQDGSLRWNYVTLSPLRDDDGKAVAVSHAAIDVQENKELALKLNEKTRALEESEAKYKNYMSNAADAILIMDPEFNIVEANHQMTVLVGVGAESLAGGSVFAAGIIPRTEHEHLREVAARMLEDRHPRQFEMELIRRDGTSIDVEVRSIPMFIHDEPAGWQLIFRDVTRRKREEFEKNLLLSISQSIKEAPDLESLAQSALTGICAILNLPVGSLFIQDKDTSELKLMAFQGISAHDLTSVAVQTAEWSMKGGVASRSALLKKNIVVPDIYDLKLSAIVRNRLSTLGLKSLISIPLVVEGRLEGVIQLMAREYKEFSDERQAIIQQVGNELAMGIARQKLLDVIREKNRELIAKNQEIENTTMQLLQSEKMASIGALAAGVAHEINNPMGYIASNLNVLGEYRNDLVNLYQVYRENLLALEKLPDPEVRSRLAEIRKAEQELKPRELLDELLNIVEECKEGSKRVKTIIRDLREFSHPQTGTPQWFDLHQGLQSTINIVWNEIKYKATVEKKFGDLPQIKGFPQELNQVFMNMLVNAAHAIPERGSITITTYTIKDSAYVEISDTGVGIPPENLSRIFDPFFTTKAVGKGTGLGLAISYRIVQKHGGEIMVDSKVGKGTTFTIRLPVSGPEQMKEAS
jgi:PAS domain S-box-containing protein